LLVLRWAVPGHHPACFVPVEKRRLNDLGVTGAADHVGAIHQREEGQTGEAGEAGHADRACAEIQLQKHSEESPCGEAPSRLVLIVGSTLRQRSRCSTPPPSTTLQVGGSWSLNPRSWPHAVWRAAQRLVLMHPCTEFPDAQRLQSKKRDLCGDRAGSALRRRASA